MNIQQAKAIPIAEILERMGQRPTKQGVVENWYKSPLREEKTASFHANIKKNIWFDFGLGIGGDAIDLVSKYLEMEGLGNTVSDALRWLDNMFDQAPLLEKFDHKEPSHQPSAAPFVLRSVKPINHRALENYLSDRGIPLNVASKYLKEIRIYNKDSGKVFFALGLKNEEGGYEVRNQRFKGSINGKDISFIRGTDPNKKEINLFEGMFDFLSAVTQNNGRAFKADTIVLNSLFMLTKATPYIKGYGYRVAYTWLDNDEPGKSATKALAEFFQEEEGLRHVPMNDRYAPYIDVNAAHMAKLGLSME